MHAAHWGAFLAEVRDGRLTAAHPFPGDPMPSALLDSMPDMVHAKTRIDRPYIRRGWLRGDRAGGTPRGGDMFVPMDWDSATRLVGDEIARVRDRHGPASIFGSSNGWASAGRFHHAKTQLQRLLVAAGGYTGAWTNYSYAAGMTLMPHVVGNIDCIQGPVADWRAICREARILLCFGGILVRNSQIVAGGGGRHDMNHWVHEAAKAGIRLVYVSPVRADMPADVTAEWIPIRPNTDTAMMLAMAHVLIDESLCDAGFIGRCTVGFDRVRAYVMGEATAWRRRRRGRRPLPACRPRPFAILPGRARDRRR